MLMVMASLAAMVAVALLDPFFNVTCDDSVLVIVPNVTVNPSATSERESSDMAIVIVCVDPAALFAANVTVPLVDPRSAASAPSVPNGAVHPTLTSAATCLDRVTVNSALEPSVDVRRRSRYAQLRTVHVPRRRRALVIVRQGDGSRTHAQSRHGGAPRDRYRLVSLHHHVVRRRDGDAARAA